MPRLIDKLDAAAGNVPEVLEIEGVDYLEQREGPATLVDDEGHYRAGWYRSFDGALNFDDSIALPLAFQCWYHLSVDAPDHFVVLNLADLTKGSNSAILVVDKRTGRFDARTETALGPARRVSMDDDGQRFVDDNAGAFVRVHGDRVDFALGIDGLHLVGRARQALGPPLVQITRFQRGRGSLQWYGCLEIEYAQLAVGDQVIPIPPGTLCTYDRTMGHQRGIQNWNWMAAAGSAVDLDSGETLPLGIQIARDRQDARPRVDGHKHCVWLDGQLHKVPTAAFVYDFDDETRKTGPWSVVSPQPPEHQGREGFDLSFEPRYHRREQKRLYLVRTDFNQYYGTLGGELVVGGRHLRLEPCFAVFEDSLLEL